jgi:hypothetical protein
MRKNHSYKKGIRKYNKTARQSKKHVNSSKQQAGRVLHALGKFKLKNTRKGNNLHKLQKQIPRLSHYTL